jgi:hypothetical protein
MNRVEWAIAEQMGFSKDEAWGLPYKMDMGTVWLLCAVRQMYRARYDPDATFVVHVGYAAGGHSENSYHYKGMAVDFHIKTKLTFSEQVGAIEAILVEFGVHLLTGLGIYPDWNSPGFHLDKRGQKGRWGRIGQQYTALRAAFEHAKSKEDGHEG